MKLKSNCIICPKCKKTNIPIRKPFCYICRKCRIVLDYQDMKKQGFIPHE